MWNCCVCWRYSRSKRYCSTSRDYFKNKDIYKDPGINRGVTEPRTVIKPTGLKVFAEWLLELPRSIKQSILLLGDYLVSILCLFLALSLRNGVLDVNASPILVALYSLVPIIGLYLIGFYRGVTRIFFDTDMRRVLGLFVGILIAFTIVYLFNLISSIPRSVPLLYLFMLFIWLWSSRLFCEIYCCGCKVNRYIKTSIISLSSATRWSFMGRGHPAPSYLKLYKALRVMKWLLLLTMTLV